MELKRSISLKRNTLVLFAVLVILAIFGWAGWANWEYRQQAAEKLLATAAKGELELEADMGTGHCAGAPKLTAHILVQSFPQKNRSFAPKI